MLSYLHAFHAGNFADVHKHAALMLAVRMMQVKKSGIACFDTHAGSARYDLTEERALKTGEAMSGIQRVWQYRSHLSGEDWQAFLDVLKAENAGDDTRSGPSLQCYPGSPQWFNRYLREQDTLTAFELHPAESSALAHWAENKPEIRVFQEDGLQGALKRLPPKQPRILTLTDPSYEVKTDYEEVASTLGRMWQKCRHGVYLIWYPLLAGRPDDKLKQTITAGPVRKVLCSEITLRQTPERGMSGSGMLVVNPPWGFDARLAEMLRAAADDDCLGISSEMSWLVPE
jgi:23S rRNA (adenine2030-N6)-methyltransferase